MKLLIIPLICLIIGTGAGVGAGIFLAPEPPPEDAIVAETPAVEELTEEQAIEIAREENGLEYVDLSSQFIVPLLVDGKVDAIVVLAIGLEIIEGTMQEVMLSEPKLRAAFLQSLFNHSNNGGFSGNFTAYASMDSLRRELLAIARGVSGDKITDVLILDVVRQNP